MNQKDMPLVTAVVPVYNHDKYVIESIRSVINQTYHNIELIVINDGSKDGSHERVLSLSEICNQRFVRFEYINRQNIGLSATLNQALSMANGKYFSAIASDDIALPGKIESLVSALEAKGPEYAAAFGNALFIDGHSCKLWLSQRGIASSVGNGAVYENYLDFRTNGGSVVDYRGSDFGAFSTLLAHNYLPAMSNLVRTELIRQVGAWTNGNASEDWEMWRKLSKQYRFVYIDEPVALYRWHDGNSVKIIRDQLKLCSLRLLREEKHYCANNSLTLLWREAYVSLLFPVLLDKGIAFKKKLSATDRSEMVYIFLYVAKRLARKAFRMLKKGRFQHQSAKNSE
jgi:alpha-1,3-rhamnosyltransferase